MLLLAFEGAGNGVPQWFNHPNHRPILEKRAWWALIPDRSGRIDSKFTIPKSRRIVLDRSKVNHIDRPGRKGETRRQPICLGPSRA
jgi:hypothetical protein